MNPTGSTTPTKIKDYLQEELQKICLLEATLNPNLITIDEAEDIYRQIQIEILPQYDIEASQLDDYLRQLEIEEKLFEDSILTSNNNFKQIICPVCQKSNLIQTQSWLKCQKDCGFRVDSIKTGIDVNQLEQRLEIAMNKHENCNEIPQFQFKTFESVGSNANTINNEQILFSQLSTLPQASCLLIMTCEKCQLMHMVI